MSDPLALAEFSATVTLQDTAATIMSGSLQVLATPQLIAWMERAAVMACQEFLGTGQTTVGAEISVQHIAPSVIGRMIHITAKVIEQNGKKLHVEISAQDEGGPIASASHTRYIVDSQRFMEKAHARQAHNEET